MDKKKKSAFFLQIQLFLQHNRYLVSLLVRTVIFILGLKAINIVSNLLIGRIVDQVSCAETMYLIKEIGILLCLLLINYPISYYTNWNAGNLSAKCIQEMRDYTYHSILKASMECLDNSQTGDILSRVNKDIVSLMDAVNELLTWELSNFIAMLVAMIVCFFMNWKLSLISFIVIPVLAFFQAQTGKPIAGLIKKRAEADGEASSIFVDLLNGLTISKAFGLEKEMCVRYGEKVDYSVKCSTKSFFIEFLMLPIQMALDFLPQIIIVSIGSLFVLNGSMTLGSLLSYILIFNYVTSAIGSLSWEIRDIYHAAGLASRIFDVWNLPQEDMGKKQKEKNSEFPITFENVSFSYKNKNDTLSAINLSIKPHEKVALVGMSGSGKSTILKLILRLYTHDKGKIKVFGNFIEDWDIKELRKHISYVDQNTYLFPKSILDNLRLVNPDASIEQIQEILSKLGLSKLDIHDVVGERGTKLSGGQRQRIAIARALLKECDIIMLDEPTSALDTESEYYIYNVINETIKDKTCIVAAHRLSAIRNFDRIICLEKGKIIEVGNHEELMSQKGVYYQLYREQEKVGE